MESWQNATTILAWLIYIIVFISIIGFFVILLIRRNLMQESDRILELSNLEEMHLRDLLKKHIQTQEFERERIGSDLHDEISNRLNTILLKLRFGANIDTIEESLNEAIYAVRRLSHDLNPPMIDKISVDLLIISQFDQISDRYKINKTVKIHHYLNFSNEIKINILRIVQELINNIIKHSEATEVNMMIRKSVSGFALIISDNGKGTDLDKNGMGLENIENRIFILKGKFKMKSEPGKGFKTIITMGNGI